MFQTRVSLTVCLSVSLGICCSGTASAVIPSRLLVVPGGHGALHLLRSQSSSLSVFPGSPFPPLSPFPRYQFPSISVSLALHFSRSQRPGLKATIPIFQNPATHTPYTHSWPSGLLPGCLLPSLSSLSLPLSLSLSPSLGRLMRHAHMVGDGELVPSAPPALCPAA